jgi:hypothetical protein
MSTILYVPEGENFCPVHLPTNISGFNRKSMQEFYVFILQNIARQLKYGAIRTSMDLQLMIMEGESMIRKIAKIIFNIEGLYFLVSVIDCDDNIFTFGIADWTIRIVTPRSSERLRGLDLLIIDGLIIDRIEECMISDLLIYDGLYHDMYTSIKGEKIDVFVRVLTENKDRFFIVSYV